MSGEVAGVCRCESSPPGFVAADVIHCGGCGGHFPLKTCKTHGWPNLSDLWKWVVDINDEFSPRLRRTPWRQNALGCALGLFGETAELVDIHKHRLGMGSQQKVFSKDEVGEELFDLFVYWVMTCVSEGFSIGDLVAIFERKKVTIRRRLEDRAAGGLGQIPMEHPTG